MTWKCTGTGFQTVVLKEWSGSGFVDMKVYGDRFKKSCLKRGVVVVRGLFTWSCTGTGFQNIVLTHSVPRNEALVPRGCAPAARGTRASFRELYFCRLGKHSQTETGSKTNCLPMKGENDILPIALF